MSWVRDVQESRRRPTPKSQGVLVLIAVADLSVRYGDLLARYFSAEHAVRYVESVLSILFSGISLGIGVGVVDLTQWLLFVGVLGYLAPKLYPEPLEAVTKTVPVRLLVAATGVGFAIVLANIDGLDDAGLLPVVGFVFFVAISAVLRIEGVSPYDEAGPLVSGINRFARYDGVAEDELNRAKSYNGWRRSLALGLFAAAAYVVLFAPTLVAGVVVMMLAETFPFPDLLVLGYVLSGIVAARTERLSAPPDTLEVEEYLLKFTGHATDGVQSMFVVMLFGIGIFVTVITPVLIIRPAVGLLLPTLRPPILPLLAWNVLGLYALTLGGVLYGLWFWLRTAPRIAAFLERWNDEPRETSLASRPKSLLLPSFVATAVATAGLSNDFLGENRHLFAVVWPAVAMGVVWVARRARRRHPTVPRREDFAVVVAVLIAYLTLMGSLAIGRGDPAVLLTPQVGLFCGLILYVSAIGRVHRYGNRHNRRYGDDTDDERRYAFPLYLGLGGVLALLTTGYLAGALQILIFVCGIALLGFAVVTGVTNHYRL